MLQYFAGRLLGLHCPAAYQKFDGNLLAQVEIDRGADYPQATSGTPTESISLIPSAADRAAMLGPVVHDLPCDVAAFGVKIIDEIKVFSSSSLHVLSAGLRVSLHLIASTNDIISSGEYNNGSAAKVHPGKPFLTRDLTRKRHKGGQSLVGLQGTLPMPDQPGLVSDIVLRFSCQ